MWSGAHFSRACSGSLSGVIVKYCRMKHLCFVMPNNLRSNPDIPVLTDAKKVNWDQAKKNKKSNMPKSFATHARIRMHAHTKQQAKLCKPTMVVVSPHDDSSVWTRSRREVFLHTSSASGCVCSAACMSEHFQTLQPVSSSLRQPHQSRLLQSYCTGK